MIGNVMLLVAACALGNLIGQVLGEYIARKRSKGDELRMGEVCEHGDGSCSQCAECEEVIALRLGFAASCAHRDQLRAEVERVTKERDEALRVLAQSAELDARMIEGLEWIESVKEASVCAFCAPSTPENQAKAQEHMRTCEKHPLGAARARVDALESALREIVDVESRLERPPALADHTPWFAHIAKRALEGE